MNKAQHDKMVSLVATRTDAGVAEKFNPRRIRRRQIVSCGRSSAADKGIDGLVYELS